MGGPGTLPPPPHAVHIRGGGGGGDPAQGPGNLYGDEPFVSLRARRKEGRKNPHVVRGRPLPGLALGGALTSKAKKARPGLWGARGSGPRQEKKEKTSRKNLMMRLLAGWGQGQKGSLQSTKGGRRGHPLPPRR